MQKINLIEPKEVTGNLQSYTQHYDLSFMPKTNLLNEKLILTINTDIQNSLRFMNENQFKEFIADCIYSLITFKELKYNIDSNVKASFRNAHFEDIITKSRMDCINKWKEKKIIQYQKCL